MISTLTRLARKCRILGKPDTRPVGIPEDERTQPAVGTGLIPRKARSLDELIRCKQRQLRARRSSTDLNLEGWGFAPGTFA
jgi:hypothetical protein